MKVYYMNNLEGEYQEYLREEMDKPGVIQPRWMFLQDAYDTSKGIMHYFKYQIVYIQVPSTFYY